MKLLAYAVILFLIFWGIFIVFSTWLQHFTSPPTVHNGPSLSTCLPATVTFSFVSIYLILVVLGLCYCERAFSSWGERGLLSSCGARAFHCCGFFVAERGGLSARGLHSCSSWELKYRLRAVCVPLRCMGLAAPWHVGSSWIRDWTHVSCTGKWILYHLATREALKNFLR